MTSFTRFTTSSGRAYARRALFAVPGPIAVTVEVKPGMSDGDIEAALDRAEASGTLVQAHSAARMAVPRERG